MPSQYKGHLPGTFPPQAVKHWQHSTPTSPSTIQSDISKSAKDKFGAKPRVFVSSIPKAPSCEATSQPEGGFYLCILCHCLTDLVVLCDSDRIIASLIREPEDGEMCGDGKVLRNHPTIISRSDLFSRHSMMCQLMLTIIL